MKITQNYPYIYSVKNNLVDYFEITPNNQFSLKELVDKISTNMISVKVQDTYSGNQSKDIDILLKGRGVIHYIVQEPELSSLQSIDLAGETIVIPNNYHLLTNLSFTNGSIVQSGTLDIEDFGAVGDGTTDDSAAIESAIECANYIVNQQNNLSNINIQFPCGKTYLISKGFKLNFGVSIDFGGSTLKIDNSNKLPEIQPGTTQYIKYEDLYYVFVANAIVTPPDNATERDYVVTDTDREYPTQNGNYFRNIKFKVSSPIKNLGFLLLAQPIIVSDIRSWNICPVVDTLGLSENGSNKKCYLDALNIQRVRVNYTKEDQSLPIHPYVIRKRCNGDSMLIDQLVNECGYVDEDQISVDNHKIYGIYINECQSLTISNSIHPDGEILNSTAVSFVANHCERCGLKIKHSSISIRDCFFTKPLTSPVLEIYEYQMGENTAWRYNTISLENVIIKMFNDLPYPADIEEIAFRGQGTSTFHYRNVQVRPFGPVLPKKDLQYPSRGFSYTCYSGPMMHTLFRDGQIDFHNGVPSNINGRSIAFRTPIDSMTVSGKDYVFDNIKQLSYGAMEYGDYQYKVYFVNGFSSRPQIGWHSDVVFENGADRVSVPEPIKNDKEEVTSGGIVTFTINPEPIDGCYVVLVRKNITTSAVDYVSMPVLRTGLIVDCGKWVNAKKWIRVSSESNVPGINSLINYKDGERIDIDSTGIPTLYAQGLSPYLNAVSDKFRVEDLKNPIQKSFDTKKLYRVQPFSYIRQTTAARYYKISEGYIASQNTGVYENQIYTIQNGHDDSTIHVRVTFSAGACSRVVKSVDGVDFAQIFKDANGGLYICMRSSYLHKDISIQSNHVTNLAKHILDAAGPCFEYVTSTSGLTEISTQSFNSSTRPANAAVGHCIFDTSLGKPLWYKGDNQWVDATGTIVKTF